MSRINRPSPAMVVAITAIVLGTTGTTYAAVKLPAKSVGTPQLKNNAVTGPKLKNGSVAGAKVQADSLGGVQIDEATLGTVPSAESAGVDGLTYATGNAALGPSQGATFHLDCPAGLKPIGGGLRVSDPTSMFVIDGFPQGNGWTTSAANAGPNPGGVTGYVTCAKSSAATSAPPKAAAKPSIQRFRVTR